MRVISYRILREFIGAGHAAAEIPLKAWYAVASKAEWNHVADVRAAFPKTDYVGNRLIFNIGANKYRLIAVVDFPRHGLLVRFIGTHAEYDRIDVRTI